MTHNRKAPGSSAKTARGEKKNDDPHFVPFPIEHVNSASPRILPRMQSRTIDNVAASGWKWCQATSLFVDAAQIRIEKDRDDEWRRQRNGQY